jgi:hypothetical protein
MISVRHGQPRRGRTVILGGPGCCASADGAGRSRALMAQGRRGDGWIKPACVLRKHGCRVRTALLPPALRNHVAVQRNGGRCTDRTALLQQSGPSVSSVLCPR